MNSCFISIFRFCSLKNPFATITSLSELYFRFRKLFSQCTQNKWFLWTAAAQAAENRRDEWGLTWYLRWGIYTSVPTWTHGQNSLAAEEALSLKISYHGTSFIDRLDIQIIMRMVISYAMKRGIPLWIWQKVNGNWDNNVIRISQWSESHCRTNTSVRKRNKSKIVGLWESLSGIRWGKLIIWVRSFEIEKS